MVPLNLQLSNGDKMSVLNNSHVIPVTASIKSKVAYQSYSEAYLGPCQKSMMEHFLRK